jgi:hypothetical protein
MNRFEVGRIGQMPQMRRFGMTISSRDPRQS